MDVLTAELTHSILADILQEPEKALLGRVLKTIGQERCERSGGEASGRDSPVARARENRWIQG